MSTLDLPPVANPGTPLITALIAIGFIWSGTVLYLAATGVFDVPATEPALPTLIAIGLPVLAFLAAFAALPAIRTFILSLDMVLLTDLQAWRILGGVFLVVLAFGHLPASFALPAGIGDVMVGLAAPFMARQLRRNPAFLISWRYRLFLLFGLADFAVAVTTGILARNVIDSPGGSVTSAAMGQLPLVLIPTLIVPAFIILHLTAALRIWRELQHLNGGGIAN